MDANLNQPLQQQQQVQSRSDTAEKRVQQQQVDPAQSFATVLSNGRTGMRARGQSTTTVPAAHVLAAVVASSGTKTFKSRASGQAATAVSGESINLPTTNTATTTDSSSSAVSSTSSSSTSTDASLATSSTDSNQVLLQQTQQMQELNNSFNLQYLQLQENMQQDNRQWTTLSNISKTRQDTAKNSINNLH